MLRRLSEQVRACHEQAAEAKSKAEATADPAVKADFLEMEGRWLALARSHAYTESLGDFTAAMSATRHELPEPDDALRLQNISALLIKQGNIDALYDRVLDAVIGLMRADMGSMQEFDSERNELHLIAWRGFHPESAVFWKSVRLDSASTCAIALSAGRRVMVPDIEACDFLAGTDDLDSYRRSRIRAVQSTPLVSRSGQLLGMISTHWREVHQPTERALQLLDVLARQAADLIERTQIEAALRESEERSRWLASIVEFCDDAIVSKTLDGVIVSCNKSAERIFGYSAQEVIGKAMNILSPPEEEPALLERIGRVVQSRWIGAELRDLVRQELAPYRRDDESRAGIAGPPLLLEPTTAQTMAVALHEVATNAAKYGALSVPEGNVQVEWSRASDGRLVLRWIESGGPPVKKPTRKGFGTHVIERMIQGQLNGEMRFDWRVEGLVCEIMFRT